MAGLAINRRSLLHGLGLASAVLPFGRMAFAAAPTPQRFVFVIQRGAADGLDTVIPTADAGYERLRGGLRPEGNLIRLDGEFALHPALAGIGRLALAGQARFLHAVASPYRDRSHFDAQNLLETGGVAPYAAKDGWLNRLAGLSGAKGASAAVALASTMPLALRGAVDAKSFAPSNLPFPSDDLTARIDRLYGDDPQLAGLWQAARAARDTAGDEAGGRANARTVGAIAARFLAGGARIAMLETGGWDTHAGQRGRLAAQLGALDTLIDSLREGLGALWGHTTVLVATEFGRTAAANGTGGTDHGTGSVAMVLGGGIKPASRPDSLVIADWPGLAAAQLLENRDLRPTADLFGVISAAAASGLHLDPEQTAQALFPALKVHPHPALL